MAPSSIATDPVIADIYAKLSAHQTFIDQMRGGLRLAAGFNGVLVAVIVFLVTRGLG
jgi:hypothetical protein